MVKEFPGKAVLSMAAQGGLCTGPCSRRKEFFSAEGGTRGTDGRKPCHCKGYRVLRRRGGRFRMAAARWSRQIVVAKRMDLC